MAAAGGAVPGVAPGVPGAPIVYTMVNTRVTLGATAGLDARDDDFYELSRSNPLAGSLQFLQVDRPAAPAAYTGMGARGTVQSLSLIHI